MLFEMSNDLVPILVSMSVYFSIVAVHLANVIINEHVVQRRSVASEKLHGIQRFTFPEDRAVSPIGQTQSFITRIVKRKEAPEDDSDYVYSLNKKLTMINRGGKQCKATLYSRSLNDINLSF